MEPLDGQMVIEQIAWGEDTVRKAEAWIAKNPYAWSRIVQKAAEYAAQERRFAIARLVEDVRWEMKAEGVDEWKVNNNFRAVFARKLKKYPRIAPYVQVRESKTDGLV